tara:strand:- start:3109 stop:3432 length:324 start_codon:yes stop_codon:yes gene_type:complete
MLDNLIANDGVCEHNNTITNECSDCNYEEFKDSYNKEYEDNGGNESLYNDVLKYTLQTLINKLNDIIYDSIVNIDLSKRDQEELNKWCADKVALEVNRRLAMSEEVK